MFKADDDIKDFRGGELKARWLIHLVEDSRIKYRVVHNDGMFAHTVAHLAQHSDYLNAEICAHN